MQFEYSNNRQSCLIIYSLINTSTILILDIFRQFNKYFNSNMETASNKTMIPSEHVIRIFDNINDIILTKQPKTLILKGLESSQMQPIIQKYCQIADRLSLFFQEKHNENLKDILAKLQEVKIKINHWKDKLDKIGIYQDEILKQISEASDSVKTTVSKYYLEPLITLIAKKNYNLGNQIEAIIHNYEQQEIDLQQVLYDFSAQLEQNRAVITAYEQIIEQFVYYPRRRINYIDLTTIKNQYKISKVTKTRDFMVNLRNILQEMQEKYKSLNLVKENNCHQLDRQKQEADWESLLAEPAKNIFADYKAPQSTDLLNGMDIRKWNSIAITIKHLEFQNQQQQIKNSRLSRQLDEYRLSQRESTNKSKISTIFLPPENEVSLDDLMRVEDELQQKCTELKQLRQINLKLQDQNQHLINELTKITIPNKQLASSIKQQHVNQLNQQIKSKQFDQQFEFYEVICRYEQTLSDSAGLLSAEKDKLKVLKLFLQKLLLFCQNFNENQYRQQVLDKVQQIKKNGKIIQQRVTTFMQAISILQQASVFGQLLKQISKPLEDICYNCTDIQSLSYRSCRNEIIERLQLVCSDKDQTTIQLQDTSLIKSQSNVSNSNFLQDLTL